MRPIRTHLPPTRRSRGHQGGRFPALIAVCALLALAAGYFALSCKSPARCHHPVRRAAAWRGCAHARVPADRGALGRRQRGRIRRGRGGVDRIYVPTRSDAVAHVVPGSERGAGPALSPDGKWVAFFADGAIQEAPIEGEAVTIGTARDVRGISWADDGICT